VCVCMLTNIFYFSTIFSFFQALVTGAEIVSTFDNPEQVTLFVYDVWY
jgi:hypothetical protein